MTIHYCKQIEGSPVVRFVAKAWVALMDDKQWDSSSVLVTGNLQCIYALNENRRVVGCLTFHVDDSGQAVVNIAYVLPKYRRAGTYRQMHDAFVEQSKKQGAKELVNICYPTNERIRETVQKLGYHLSLEHWVKEI